MIFFHAVLYHTDHMCVHYTYGIPLYGYIHYILLNFLLLIDRLPSYFKLKNMLQGLFLNTYLGILCANIFIWFSLKLLILSFFCFAYIFPICCLP